ncbi:MAG: hypothetical protein QXR81_06785 [Candidatus Nezhaarchaeales archaeon]
MKPALVEDYKNATYRSLARSVLSNFLLENKKLPLFVALDSSILHFKRWPTIVFNPRVKGGWKAILERYYETDAYRNLNGVVAGDALLAKYATVHFLNALFKKSEEQLKQVKPGLTAQDEQDPVGALMRAVDTQVSPQASRAIQAVASALAEEAEEIRKDIEAIESFSHVGVPVAQMLEKPDEFREKARNRIIVHLVKFLQRLRREAPSLKQTRAHTLVGGRPLGIKKIQRWSELSSILPLEYLDEDLLTYKIASRTIRVSEKYGSLQNYIVYLDKSGSMSDDIKYYVSPTQTEYVPKISFAAASALALAYQLKKVGAKMTLKLFDVEVHDPIVDFAQLVDVLVKIRADSGTNISNVLHDAVKSHREEKVVIVTDGIDEVSPDAVKAAKSANLDVACVFIKTDNELLRKNFKCVRLEEARPSILLEV